MSNYYSEFSETIEMPSAAAARGLARLINLIGNLDMHEDHPRKDKIFDVLGKLFPFTDLACCYVDDCEVDGKCVWIHGMDGASGLVDVLQYAIKRWKLQPLSVNVGFSCDKPIEGGFGGCGYIITEDEIHHMNTTAWIQERMEELL